MQIRKRTLWNSSFVILFLVYFFLLRILLVPFLALCAQMRRQPFIVPSSQITVPSAPRRVSKPSSRNQRLVRPNMHHPGAGQSRTRRAAASVPAAPPGDPSAATALTTPRAPRGSGQRGGTTPVAGGPRRGASAEVPARDTPPRAAKDRANQSIHDQLQQRIPIPLAEIVDDDDGAAVDSSPVASASVNSSSSSSDANFSNGDASPKEAGVPAGAGVSNFGNDAGDIDDIDFTLPEGDYDDDELLPTDAEVSKYSFLQRLRHYMEGAKISHSTRKAVEMTLLVEAGTFVRNMDTMKKSDRETVLLRKYLSLIDEIEDECFDSPSVRSDMKLRYRGAKKNLTGESLLRKLDTEMRELRKFAAKFPGFSNPSSLPSGTTQLSHMKVPVIVKIWKKVYPNVPGVDYNDKDSVMSQVMPCWWLEHDSCKYMLTIFVHKDNKDLSSLPTTLPPGDTRENARNKRHFATQEERSISRQRVRSSMVPWRGTVM